MFVGWRSCKACLPWVPAVLGAACWVAFVTFAFVVIPAATVLEGATGRARPPVLSIMA